MTDHTSLSPVIAEHVRAVNAVDEDAIVATFSEYALVNDARAIVSYLGDLGAPARLPGCRDL